MNDTPAGTTPQSKKQAKVSEGVRLFKQIEDGFDALHALWQEGSAAGMMTVNECHRLQNKTLALKYGTLELHCDGTAIAQRNDCDVGGPTRGGGPSPQGGPGR